MTGVRSRNIPLQTLESTRSIFKALSEFGLGCRTVREQHAYLQPFARHGNAPISTQGRSFVEIVSLGNVNQIKDA